MRLFQNPVGFEPTSWKSGQMPAFPCKVAVPKTEVLEQPHIKKGIYVVYTPFWKIICPIPKRGALWD
jgi:hypothetical protein